METFTNDDLLEPIELYRTRLKEAFHNNAVKYYEDLTEQAKTNVDANQEYCKIYYSETAKADALEKKRNLRVFLLVLAYIFVTAGVVAGVILILMASNGTLDMGLGIGVGIACIIVGLLMIFGVIKLHIIIANLNALIEEHRKKAEEAKQKAWNELVSLFALYEWNMAAMLFTKTTPLIQMDQVFDREKYLYLHEKFGYEAYQGNDMSSVYVQSGSILGNPFVFEKNYCQTMQDHRYSGTLTIHWTEWVSDGKGGTKAVHRSEVLTAYYTAPEPCYYLDTWLIYGNEAAPKLSFSRYPTDLNKMSEKEIERYVKSFDKKLDKLVEKSTQKDGNFTRLSNQEFEALFNALDRDNNVEFNLLFTPLAQKNMIALLKDHETAFGDDFIFKKRKTLNYIKSAHNQYSDSLDKDPDTLMHFDYKVANQNFVDYCDKYLKDIFFDLAPLISIPLYQQHKTKEYIYNGTFAHNLTQAEIESAANSHDVKYFAHPDTRSNGVILKSSYILSDDEKDVCNITAHSFSGTDRIAYVPTMGGDGCMHDVPVHWIEYNHISKVTQFVAADTKSNRPTFESSYSSGKFNEMLSNFQGKGGILYKKRIFSFLGKDK